MIRSFALSLAGVGTPAAPPSGRCEVFGRRMRRCVARLLLLVGVVNPLAGRTASANDLLYPVPAVADAIGLPMPPLPSPWGGDHPARATDQDHPAVLHPVAAGPAESGNREDCNGCCCGKREFWYVYTRCAPFCSNLVEGFECIRYAECVGGQGWVQRTREEFLSTIDPAIPLTFYVHGNTLDHDDAVKAAERVYDNIGRGVPSFRLVLWSWPSSRIVGAGLSGNFREKAARSIWQGYYMARLVDMVDPRAPITLSGHSYGARTVCAALQTLATNELGGYEIPDRRYTYWRPMQAAQLASAVDNTDMWPGYRYGLALSQVDRMLITVNPDDRTLQFWPQVSLAGRSALGVTGIPDPGRLGEEQSKVVIMRPRAWVGKSHRFSRYTNSPQAAANLRPYMFYLDAPQQPPPVPSLPAGPIYRIPRRGLFDG